MSNNLDPDCQASQLFGPDLGTNCMQRLLADNTSTAFKLNRKEESFRVI